jgi:hypothetical protein
MPDVNIIMPRSLLERVSDNFVLPSRDQKLINVARTLAYDLATSQQGSGHSPAIDWHFELPLLKLESPKCWISVDISDFYK